MADIPQKLGDYLILEKIAQGGMAQIYKAKTTDPNGIERLVVIKRILSHISSNPEYVDMLIDEAKIAVNFTHGNIAQVYDLGKAGEDYFIVMEYVDGKTLSQILREFTEREMHVPLDIVLYCIAELCNGLEYIHQKKDSLGNPLGVVHRDISPQNIIVSYSGTVKIIDFGVAKSLEKLSHTDSGVLKGKYAYMSPEQAEGKTIDARSDLFSSGILLWELLARRRLFKRKSNPETVRAVKKDPIPLISDTRRDIPLSVNRIVDRALQRRRFRRYSNASEMAGDLRKALHEVNPDFKPVHVAEFLYRYFGPEPDEAGLPPELPQFKAQPEPKPDPQEQTPLAPRKIPEEEPTHVDVAGRWGQFGRMQDLMRKIAYVASAVSIFFGLVLALPAFFNGTLILSVSPRDAKVSIDSEVIYNDQMPLKITRGIREPFSLEVAKEGYITHRETLTLERGRALEKTIVLTADIPPFGDLQVTTQPPGATVYLNDFEWNHVTPTTIPHLERDRKYQVKVVLEGYRDRFLETSVEGGKTQPLSFALEKNYATLEIHSAPEGAHVIIDGQEIGTTPFTQNHIEPGDSYEFELSLEGYEKSTQKISLGAGEVKRVEIVLTRIGGD